MGRGYRHFSVQKALMCPPGLAMASVSRKARAVVDRDDRMPRFYFDFRRALISFERSEPPFTAPVSLLCGLKEGLQMIHQEGLVEVVERHRLLAKALRVGLEALGFEPFDDPNALSSTVVVMSVPKPFSGDDIVRHMYTCYRTTITGARNHWSGKIIRIGMMGYVSSEDVLVDLFYLERTLRDLGGSAQHSCGGVSAAAEVLSGALT